MTGWPGNSEQGGRVAGGPANLLMQRSIPVFFLRLMRGACMRVI